MTLVIGEDSAERIEELVQQINIELHEIIQREILSKTSQTTVEYIVLNHQNILMRFIIKLLKEYLDSTERYINDYMEILKEKFGYY